MRAERRNFKDPQYVKWRKAIYARDKSTCRMCGSRNRLQAHHIKRWADAPHLRYDKNNGITLCDCCHSLVKDREDEYAGRFAEIISKAFTPKYKRGNMVDGLINMNIELAKRRKNEEI